MYANKQFKFEDIPRLKKDIEVFKKFQKQLQIKDLNAYKNLDALYTALEPFENRTSELSKKQQISKQKGDVEYIVNTPNFKALIPKTSSAASIYGRGTRWCTTAAPDFKHYSNKGDLIIILAKLNGKDRKFQFHFETNSFMNERDQPASKQDLEELAASPEYVSFLHKLIDKYHP